MHITSSPERYCRWLKVIPGQECKNAPVSRIAENSMLSRLTGRYPEISEVCTVQACLNRVGPRNHRLCKSRWFFYFHRNTFGGDCNV